FGYGLNNEELNGLGKTSLVFHPNALPTGFSAITWQKKLAPGDRLFVQGRFNNSLSNPVKVVLTGLHTHLDSVMLPANSHINFQLKTIPRHLDRAVYNLVVFNKKDTVGIEDLPVEIEEKKRLQILILSASPDFENKFLKNRLSQNGYSIAIRSRISKNIFQKEYVNVQGISLDNISGSLPDKFDVVIADATELRSINRSELLATQSAVQKGIGLIVKADSSSNKSAFYLRDFSVVKGKATTNKNIALHLKNSHDTIPRFVVENTFHIRFRPGIQSIISDDGGAIFAANVLYGNGKIVLTTLQNTYALQLAGNQINYDDIWSALLNAAAKKDLPVQVVTTSPALPRVHQPVSVSIKSTVANPEPLQFGEEKVYLQQDKLLPFKYTGTYWPRETGWLPNVSGEGKINWLYIYKNSGWYALNAFTKATATAQYARDNQPSKSNKKRLEKDVPVSVPKIYFLIIFITSAGFLWFEKKLS
ncbi:MAG TPA: hypothetical protein VF610_05025, partial [Segetibacter sp.]